MIKIQKQYSELFLSIANDAKTAQAAYVAGWEAALVAVAKRLSVVEKEQTQDARQRTEELQGIPADPVASGG